MIAQRTVTNELLAFLRATPMQVGDGTAPTGGGQQYAVLRPLMTRPMGSPFNPERTLAMQYRITYVGTDPSTATGRTGQREDAEGLADRGRARLFDRTIIISGPDWRVARRELLGQGADREGNTVNIHDDIELWIVPLA